MKKLTLNQTWTECLRMWRGIAGQRKQGSRKWVITLKREYRIAHGIAPILHNCFFCEYDEVHPGAEMALCPSCPGRLVDPTFHCLVNDAYNYYNKPEAFYAKLLELNRIRKATK